MLLTLLSCASTLAVPQAQDARPHAGMLRFPDVSADSIVFVYADDLWLVPRAGGTAIPLASPAGLESFPRFRQDGEVIAFIGNYDGGRDIYTVPRAGGIPQRVTHHPGGEVLCDWSPEGELLYYTSGLGGLPRQNQLMLVGESGGLPRQMPVPYGTMGAISPDGRWLAYTPHTHDGRTWKRYRGGMATDIWLFDLTTKQSKRVTDWEGTDTSPMWHGKLLYYMSDSGQSHRANIWVYDPASERHRQVTDFAEHDVRWPSIGPGDRGQGEIVFQLGSELRLLDLGTERSRVVEVSIPGARPTLRPRSVDASKFLSGGSISPSGKRVATSGRGDVWTLPAKNGVPRNLTRTSGVFERNPAWSPDGRWIAYSADTTGEYEIYLLASDGSGEPRKLTEGSTSYRSLPFWSPDSKLVGFFDKACNMYLHAIDSGETWIVDRNPAGTYPPFMDPSWSHDSKWLAYTRSGEGARDASRIHIYELATRTSHAVTSGMFQDGTPTFDRKGEYLYYESNRSFSPLYGDLDTSFVYPDSGVILVVPLRKDIASPFAPKSDEEEWKKEDADEKGEKSEAKEEEGAEGKEAGPAEPEGAADEAESPAGETSKDEKGKKTEKDEKPLVIDLEGFERRAIPLPIESGSFRGMAVNDKGHLLFLRGQPRGARGPTALKIFDVAAEAPEEKVVAEKADGFQLTADGKKALVSEGGKWTIQDAAAGSKAEPIVMAGMTAMIDPRAEWRQIVRDVWRIQRDFFYVENMHGVDWEGVWRAYEPMLADCVSRQDVAHVIREMISELNVGHAYYSGGDVEEEPRASVGMLGADFELADGAYRIQRIHEGAPWDSDARGPLSQPGVGVQVGDYLLAVNGVPVDVTKDPWAAFVGLAGKNVTITVSSSPVIDEEARKIVVQPLASEMDLRYRGWIERNRKHVEERTAGKVGYIYVPDTGVGGQNDLVRQYFGQLSKQGLVIDERWNGGGQIPTRFIELLNRPITNYWARRDGYDWPWPPDAHQGPKVMLINGLAGSGGDAFPAYFRQAGLGKLVGMRTWGGLVGISGNPGLIDGASTTAPTFGYYEKDGTWGIEGHGVDPDIEVVDDPALMVEGGDPQLEAAIEWILGEIERSPYVPPRRPSPPDRRGMGVRPEER